VLYPYADWELAEFAQSYRENPCRHIETRRKKRRAAVSPRRRCNYFQVTEFSILLKLTIHATTGRVLTVTRPDGTRKTIVVGERNLTLTSEANPVAGQWKVCINTGNFQLFPTNTILLDTTVVYVDNENTSSPLSPPACKLL